MRTIFLTALLAVAGFCLATENVTPSSYLKPWNAVLACAPDLAWQIDGVSKPIFDAEIAFSLNKVLPDRSIRISNLTTHGITNSEVRKQFTTCLTELVKKEVADMQKFDATKK